MKKIYKILLGILLAFFILLISIPFLFQDKIVNLVKTTINNNLNAQVDFNEASLSLIKNFPNASVQLSNVTVINNAPFKGDTLVFAKNISLKLKLTDLFKSASEQLSIQSFTIDNALVNVLVNEKGDANYNITIPSDTKTEATTNEPSNFGLSIKSYAITNSVIKYTDAKGKMSLELSDFNHNGSGDFSQSNTELKTETTTAISFSLDGTSYAKNQKLQLDAILGMDLINNKFSFLKNELKLNKLPLIFDGYVQLNDSNQEININFNTPSSDFKNFLGLIPETYTKSIANVTTNGNFSVNGKVNGILDETHIPKLDIVVQSKNASFKYPDLPKSVENININAQVKNTTGKLKNTVVNLTNLSFKIDEDTFSSTASVNNITTNPKINATIKGALNLGKINQAYPIDLKNELSGILKADLSTQFDLNAIKNNQLNRIKNNGKISVTDFVFSSKDIVNTLHIKNTEIDFKPSLISLTKFDAKTGKSDLNASGTLKNVLGFLLSNKKLQGNLNVKSNAFYVSDFMQENTDETSTENTNNQEVATESLKIPAFLDCAVLADVKTVHYDNLTLKNVKGKLLLKDEKAILQNVNASVFKGKITLNGEVNTQQKTPSFNMDLGLKSFDIAQSFNGLDLLKSISPIIGAMNGKLNSDINLSGNLTKDFTPNLASLSGKALAELLTTKIDPKSTKSLSLLNDKLSFIDLSKIDLSDIKTHLSFNNGEVSVKPFKLNYKDIGINIGGSHSFDQNMNYNITLDVPAKYLGKDVQGLLSKLSAKEQNVTVPITANITGNMANPSVKTDLSSSVTKLSQKLIQQQKDKLINNTLGNLLGTKKKDTTKTSATKQEDKAKKVTNALKGLFGKKKKKGGN
ncbi:AsmA-like C-terminal region-containing protein [Tenacibaculum insulae]|uniref:AsmA-like C-terminal region-containing protein n=1 Tax=Tenacibaculum insulae TaxID=2029677 RepID=UPI003AB7F305